jgi:hypothetical protein
MSKRTAQAAQPDQLTADTPTAKAAKIAKPKQEVVVNKNPPAKVDPPLPANILAVIARAAADPALNADKMRALLDMQKEVMAEEARLAFVRDFRKLRLALPTIKRDGKIEVRKKDPKTGDRTGAVQQTTFFATYENLMKVCEPILIENGFSFSSAVEPSADGLRINVISFLDHDQGHQRLSRFPLPAETSGSKNNVQGWGSAQSYGKRYNAVALLNIISEDPRDSDTDGGNPNRPVVSDKSKRNAAPQPKEETDDSGATDVITAEQIAELNRKMMDCEVPLAKVLQSYEIEKLEQMPALAFASALRSCDNYKKRLDAKKAEVR